MQGLPRHDDAGLDDRWITRLVEEGPYVAGLVLIHQIAGDVDLDHRAGLARGRLAATEKVRVVRRRTGQHPQSQLARLAPAQDLSQRRLDVVVTDDEVVARLRVDGESGMTKVGVDDTGLVLLVVIDPQLDRRTFHGYMVPVLTQPGS